MVWARAQPAHRCIDSNPYVSPYMKVKQTETRTLTVNLRHHETYSGHIQAQEDAGPSDRAGKERPTWGLAPGEGCAWMACSCSCTRISCWRSASFSSSARL